MSKYSKIEYIHLRIMSKGKVIKYMHEEAEEEDYEEIRDPKPYKHPQTEEQKQINRLTRTLNRKKQERKSLKQAYDEVIHERNVWMNQCTQ